MMLTIYVTTHKTTPAPSDPSYKLLQCGSGLNDDLGYLRDDAGDNISKRNKHYSELTGHYWVWKNDTDSSIIGLVHYRRFFAADNDYFQHSGKSIATGSDLEQQLANNDILVVNPLTFFHPGTQIPCAVEQQYAGTADLFDILQLRQAISDVENTYLAAFDFVMRNNKLVPFNMFVAKKDVFMAYSQWLFKVLFRAE